MGNEHSSDASEGGETFGFRVLGIQENSPGSALGLVLFFDFIVAVNKIRLDQRNSTFMEVIAANEGKEIELDVFNVKAQTTRNIKMIPSRNWPGKGLLGVTIRFDNFASTDDQVVHILEVAQNSPAKIAQLAAYDDFLLGTPEHVFNDPDDLFDTILDNLHRSFQCYAYNAKLDQVRLVTIRPKQGWGGEGYLGAEVGHGYLHRLPEQSRKTIGTSVGFVSIPATMEAATDKFAGIKTDEQANAHLQDDASTENPLDKKSIQEETNESRDDNKVIAIAEKGAGLTPLHSSTPVHASSSGTSGKPVVVASIGNAIKTLPVSTVATVLDSNPNAY